MHFAGGLFFCEFMFKNVHNNGMIYIDRGDFMKYMMQICIIATISFIAELLHFFLPLPIPASVYGLILMFVLLCLKIIKLPQIEDVADWMLSIMPIFFIAPSVGLINSFDSIKGQVIPLVLICFVSTMVVTALTGLVAQGIIRLQKKRKGGEANE